MGLKSKAAKTGIEAANSTTTVLGGTDAVLKGQEASRLVGLSNKAVPYRNAYNAANSAGRGVPGAGLLGHFGGALATFGLGMDLANILDNGVNADNGISAATNALGTGAWAAGTLGAAGGTAASVAAPVMAAGAAGLTVGTYGNSVIERLGWLGKSGEVGEDGKKKNRNWSDLASDWAYNADSTLGAVGGFVAGTAVGAIGATGSALYGAGEGAVGAIEDAGRSYLGLDNPLLDGAAMRVARARHQIANDNKGGER